MPLVMLSHFPLLDFFLPHCPLNIEIPVGLQIGPHTHAEQEEIEEQTGHFRLVVEGLMSKGIYI